MLEVIETVKRIADVNFKVERGARRPGDLAQIVTAANQIKSAFGWQLQYDDLSKIVGHALGWGRKLMAMHA